jgi:cysteine-rich repeat protein
VTDFALGESCDDGNTKSGDGCSATCDIETPAACGDGNLDAPAEECDDGGVAPGDGCDGACQLEVVGTTCGDDNHDAPLEKCDDGGTVSGDGCNSTCNFLEKVTELMAGSVPGNSLASDGTHLYSFGGGSQCQIHRMNIGACLAGTCTFAPFVGDGANWGGSNCTAGPTDGPGATALIGSQAEGLVFGRGKLYFSDRGTIRVVDLGSANLDVTTIAGDPAKCGHADGIGSAMVASDIRRMAFVGDLLYFVDANMGTLRSLDPDTGEVLTVAGSPSNDNSGSSYSCGASLCCGTGMTQDGVGSAGLMNSPRYLTGDNSGNLYIIDTNGNEIRRFNTVTGYLDTIVGNVSCVPDMSTTCYTDGTGLAVELDRGRGITSDGTNVFFGEQDENTIRQVDPLASTVETLVGVRGCAGPANLTGSASGGDGTQDWSGACGNAMVSAKPQFSTGIVGMTYHFATRSIYMVNANKDLLRIE